MIRYIIHILLFLLPGVQFASAQDIRIGLFNDQLVESFVFNCMKGSYSIQNEGKPFVLLREGELVYLSLAGDKINIENGEDISGSFSQLEFSDPSMKSEFSLKPVSPAFDSRTYDGELEVNLKHRVFHLVNILEMDQYLAGVVETEGGPRAPDEFFKVQSVLARTYAIQNWEKHISEGFNLCDGVHCQAYHGRNDENPEILNAVYSTHNIVIADFSYKLISAPFHSNSGGETQKAEGFWPGQHDYLLAILDPFSEEGKNSSWTDKIDWGTWKNYFIARGVKIKLIDTLDLIIKQVHRKENLVLGKDTISMNEIRQDFGFKSAFFNMRLEGGKLIVDGRGYGHGVGLSQEGAMQMAKQGYNYKDILRFYYDNIRIYDLNDLPLNSLPEDFR